MNEELITYDTAVLAKEKGFDLQCRHSISETGKIDSSYDYTGREFFDKEDIDSARENEHIQLLCPTQSHLQKWLREKHGIHVLIDWKGFEKDHISDNNWAFYQGRCKTNNPRTENFKEGFKTYEQALEKGLQQALKLITNKEK